ncbi:MAG: hypothetical protein ACRC6C_01310 [Wolbachia pipientis]
MEPIFPQCAFGSVNLPVWQNNVIRRFSEHKKYRVLLWEFGPTLLDHLHRVKEGKSPDYTKSGLTLTYSIASVALFVSFASTRRVTFTAAVTSGIVLLGISTTVAIDYQKTKRKDSSEVTSQEYCLGLLEALGNTPQYWWWPWSKKIKDVESTKEQRERAINYDRYSFLRRLVLGLFTNVIAHQWHIVQYGYIYNYQQLTKEGCMLNVGDVGKKVLEAGVTALGVGVTLGVGGVMVACSYLAGRHAEEVGTLAIADKFSYLIRAVILSNNIDNDSSITLNKALKSFELKWLLTCLDISLKDVEIGKKSKEEHNRYAKDRINDVKRLSLKYHPDVQAGIQNANSVQQRINAILEALCT